MQFEWRPSKLRAFESTDVEPGSDVAAVALGMAREPSAVPSQAATAA